MSEDETAGMGIICLECRCGRRTWLHAGDFGYPTDAELRRKLKCTACGGAVATIIRPPVEVNPSALLHVPKQIENYSVEEWDTQRDRALNLFALSSGVSVGLAAFGQVCAELPDKWILLRQGARIVRNSRKQDR